MVVSTFSLLRSSCCHILIVFDFIDALAALRQQVVDVILNLFGGLCMSAILSKWLKFLPDKLLHFCLHLWI